MSAAREELRVVGQAAFTMDAVARRAFYSPGALYERWPDREDLITDVALHISADVNSQLASVDEPSAAIGWALHDGGELLALASEVMIAGHASSRIREVALDTWTGLLQGLRRTLPPGMAWYIGVVGLGEAMLSSIGLPGPERIPERVEWLTDACAIEVEDRHVPRSGAQAGADVPAVPPPARSDPTAQALIQAAQALLAERGAVGLSTRRVSAAAGVSTGAIYRRYASKASLLSDVLLVELAPDRYEWTWELVQALASDDPYWAAADVMTDKLIAAASDQAEQRVLLQIGVAARTDSVLRAQVQERVRVAHDARREMFVRLAEVGLMRDDVSPAIFARGFQSEPVGLRAIMPLGIPLDERAARTSMRAVLTAAAARE